VGPSGVPDLDTAVSGRRNVRPRGVWLSQMTWHSVDRGGARWSGGTQSGVLDLDRCGTRKMGNEGVSYLWSTGSLAYAGGL
jgi:hypothetical protein